MSEYEKIITIMNQINSSINFQNLLNTIIDSAKELLRAEGASLLLLDEENDELIFDVVVSEKGEIIRGKRLKVGEGIVGYVARHEEDVIVRDVSGDKRFYTEIDMRSGFVTKSIIAVPVKMKEKLIGVLEVVNSTRPESFIDRDMTMLKYIADAAAVAINNHELVISLRNRVNELTCIYEISQSIYFTFDIREFLYKILKAVNEVIKAEKCSFVIVNEIGTDVEYFVSTKDDNYSVDLENSLMAHVLKTGDPLLVYDVENDAQFITAQEKTKRYNSKSFICVPMKLRERVVGVMNVTDKPRGEIFDSFDLRVLSTVANQVAETYENVLLQKEKYERERINNELSIAADIQMRSMSVIPEWISEVSIGAFTIPSSYVGGDFYDITVFDERFFSGSVGDVSGKGIPAAIFMNSVRNALRFEAVMNKEPLTIMERINNWVYRESLSGMFCTFFYFLADLKKKIVTYCSAGHNAQLYFESETNTFHTLKTKGRPLGIEENAEFESGTFSYESGDFLILFTDGLVEESYEGMMQINDIKDYIRTNRLIEADAIADTVKKRIMDSKTELMRDDSTFVLIKFH